MVICVGDSLTLGAVGYSYIPFTDRKYKMVNHGVNGDSLYGGYTRLLKYLEREEYEGADTYIVGLGTNDILLPFLGEKTKSWKMKVEMKNQRLQFSTTELQFEELYEKVIIEVLKRDHRLILIGLPYIQLPDYPLYKVKQYNACIKRLAKIYSAEYIDIYSAQERHLHKVMTYPWGKSNLKRLTDGICMTLFPMRKDVLSKRRALELTVDGVHYNSRSARLLGHLVGQRLDTM